MRAAHIPYVLASHRDGMGRGGMGLDGMAAAAMGWDGVMVGSPSLGHLEIVLITKNHLLPAARRLHQDEAWDVRPLLVVVLDFPAASGGMGWSRWDGM